MILGPAYDIITNSPFILSLLQLSSHLPTTSRAFSRCQVPNPSHRTWIWRLIALRRWWHNNWARRIQLGWNRLEWVGIGWNGLDTFGNGSKQYLLRGQGSWNIFFSWLLLRCWKKEIDSDLSPHTQRWLKVLSLAVLVSCQVVSRIASATSWLCGHTWSHSSLSMQLSTRVLVL